MNTFELDIEKLPEESELPLGDFIDPTYVTMEDIKRLQDESGFVGSIPPLVDQRVAVTSYEDSKSPDTAW